MILTDEQQKIVEKNIGLVYKVLSDKLHGSRQMGIYSYDDLFQIGCIGLCKAAATDKGGTFSTYAYRLIWNEICDALIYATRRQTTEIACDVTPYVGDSEEFREDAIAFQVDACRAIEQAKASAPPSTAKGIEAIMLMVQGYTCKEIGERMSASDKLVTAWMSKARKYLKTRPDVMSLAGGYN